MTGCGCGKPNRLFTPARVTRGPNDFYGLIMFEDCITPYQGEFAGLSIFVACPGDRQRERLFTWQQYELADAYARENGCLLDSVPTTSLCQQAVEATYAPGG